MLVAGMQYADGPGFAVLASDTARGAELLLDSSCEVDSPATGAMTDRRRQLREQLTVAKSWS